MAVLPGAEWPTFILGTFFGFVGGTVPDLDHDLGRGLQLITALLTTFIPVIAMAVWLGGNANWTVASLLLLLPSHYLLHWAIPQTGLFATKKRSALSGAILAILVAGICAVPALFFFKNLPLGIPKTWGLMLAIAIGTQLFIPIFKKITTHRGMWHSVQVAVIYAQMIYMFVSDLPFATRMSLAIAALAGAISHLILDEIYSVDLMGMRIKKSSGTAFKFWDSRYPYASTFVSILVVLMIGACMMV